MSSRSVSKPKLESWVQLRTHGYDLTNNTKPAFIVVGEKDVETLEKLGFIATSSPNGAGSHRRKDFTKYFRGFDVIVLADNDEVGLKYATEVAENVVTVARSEFRILW